MDFKEFASNFEIIHKKIEQKIVSNLTWGKSFYIYDIKEDYAVIHYYYWNNFISSEDLYFSNLFAE